MINVEQYRDKWLAEKFDDFIGFYPREFFCFDNFSSFRVLVDGVLYCTLEHAYQASKFLQTAPNIAQEIINSYSAHEAQKIAFANRDKQRKDWDEIKVSVMEKLVRLKVEQNPYVKHKLLQTKDYIICEDSPKDSFWGIGPNRDGRNELGKIYMKIRDELYKLGNN